jgi:hypothetical protein
MLNHSAKFQPLKIKKGLTFLDLLSPLLQVGRDASISKFVKVFLGVPYASPPTGNYRYKLLIFN